MIFDDSNKILSLKNPHLDNSDSKICPKTKKVLSLLRYAYRLGALRKHQILFQGLDMIYLNFWLFWTDSEVSRCGFLWLRIRLESIIFGHFQNFFFVPNFFSQKTHLKLKNAFL